jgi:hypothetical protein
MQNAFYQIMIISFFNATIIYTLNKWGFWNWVQTYKRGLMKWYPECFFCYGFHLAVIEIPIIVLFAPSWHLLYVPFCCASLTWVIFKQMINQKS